VSEAQYARLATVVTIVQKRPGLGRTALMKLCYFLQSLRRVPLGYRFTLYSYGPFESDVLSDLTSAESLGAIRSRVVQYSGGYGYEIQPTDKSELVMSLAHEFVLKHTPDIDWVIDRFAGFRASDLELLSTVIYVDREYAQTDETLNREEIVRKVHEIKPGFHEEFIADKVNYLDALNVFQSVARPRAARRHA
jgi:uncharacterized protein YwgA